MQWAMRNTVSLSLICSALFVCTYIGFIAWETLYPCETGWCAIAKFYDVKIPEESYYVGDVVRYVVKMDKYYFTPSTVVRTLECNRGSYMILPNERGEGKVGYHEFDRNFLIEDRVFAPDTCILVSTFSYENINPYHKPVKYQKESNAFCILPKSSKARCVVGK